MVCIVQRAASREQRAVKRSEQRAESSEQQSVVNSEQRAEGSELRTANTQSSTREQRANREQQAALVGSEVSTSSKPWIWPSRIARASFWLRGSPTTATALPCQHCSDRAIAPSRFPCSSSPATRSCHESTCQAPLSQPALRLSLCSLFAALCSLFTALWCCSLLEAQSSNLELPALCSLFALSTSPPSRTQVYPLTPLQAQPSASTWQK